MKILILGGGPAGCSAAYFLKQLGIDNIDLVEKEVIGGCARTRFYDSIPYEFGPQILYTDEPEIKKIFERFVVNRKAPTEDGEYHPKLSIDGRLDNLHDFPITISNVLKLGNPTKIIYELYRLNLENPDYSNFEKYMLSRIGPTLYKSYIENYNRKHWKCNPSELDADWAKKRTLTLRERNDMFQGQWQGHPGNHNKIWEGMIVGVNVIKAKGSISEDFRKVFIDEKDIKRNYDLIITTLPLSSKLPYVHTLKIYIVIKEKECNIPCYLITFPNNYNFIRIMNYNKQFYTDTNVTLLDFAFSWTDKTGIDVNKCIEEVRWFCKNILKRKIYDLFCINRRYTYPVPKLSIKKYIDEKLKMASYDKKIVPLGRCGMHAYISKDVCVRMGLIMSQNFNDILAGGRKKLSILYKMREKLR